MEPTLSLLLLRPSGIRSFAFVRDPFHGMIRERLLAQGINIDHVVTSQVITASILQVHDIPNKENIWCTDLEPRSIDRTFYDTNLIENCKIVYASSGFSLSPGSVTRFSRRSFRTQQRYNGCLRSQPQAPAGHWMMLKRVCGVFSADRCNLSSARMSPKHFSDTSVPSMSSVSSGTEVSQSWLLKSEQTDA